MRTCVCGHPSDDFHGPTGLCMRCFTLTYDRQRSEEERRRHALIVDQPPPIRSDRRPVWDLVIEDMRERDRVGRQRYGTPLQAHNGRDPLVDAYQEALDLAVYLRQAIEERGR
jgi:hypothetical protein